VLELFPDTAGQSAARFFYCAKANKKDRNEGLDDFQPKRDADRIADDGVGGANPRNRSNTAKVNHHPTVKPTDLMRYLCRLVTPPQGVVLDPFTGSGSTGKAALLEGFTFLGVEQSEDYLRIAQARIGGCGGS
jgi:site-specific DNA-methyltransferase (adenine-specific)